MTRRQRRLWIRIRNYLLPPVFWRFTGLDVSDYYFWR